MEPLQTLTRINSPDSPAAIHIDGRLSFSGASGLPFSIYIPQLIVEATYISSFSFFVLSFVSYLNKFLCVHFLFADDYNLYISLFEIDKPGDAVYKSFVISGKWPGSRLANGLGSRLANGQV